MNVGQTLSCCYNLFTVRAALNLKRHEREGETGSEARTDTTSFLSSSCHCLPLTSQEVGWTERRATWSTHTHSRDTLNGYNTVYFHCILKVQ